MSVIQLSAGLDKNAKERQPLVAVPARSRQVAVSLIIPTLNEARNLTHVRMTFGGRYSDLCYGDMAFWRHVLPTFDRGAVGIEVETFLNVGTLAAGLRVVEIASLFLDDEAADPHWAGRLTAPYADPAILGGRRIGEPVWHQPPPRWWPWESGRVVGCSYRGQPTSISRVRNLMGCTMSVRRSVPHAVGGFDIGLGRTPDSPLGCEETELGIRAQSQFAQDRFLFEPRAVVYHSVPAERASWPYFRSRCRAEGISKPRVARNVDRTAALSAESAYVRRVLPISVLHNLNRGLRGDLAALARAGAIVAGLAFTATGFLKIRWTRPAGPPQEVGSTLRNVPTDAVIEPAIDGLPPYPRDLTLRHWRGLVSGPWRYLRSRRSTRQQAVPCAERRVARDPVPPGRPSEAPPSVVTSLDSWWRARVRARGVRGAGPLLGRSRLDPKIPSGREVRNR